MSEVIKGVLRGVKKEIVTFAGDALKSGAVNIGKELANVKRDVDQPSVINLGTITTALKSGVMATGHELMTRRLERVGISPQDQNASTQPSKEEE